MLGGEGVDMHWRTSRWSAPNAASAKPEETATPATIEVHSAPHRSSMMPAASMEKTNVVDAIV